MRGLHIYLTGITGLRAFLALTLFFVFTAKSFAVDSTAVSKVSPSMKLSYKIIDGKKSVKVELSRKEGKKFIPIENLIVNLYNGEVKKYVPATAIGWVGNLVTDEDGQCVFTLSDKFNKLTEGIHSFTFIASIGSNPEYEDTQEEIIMNEVLIKLSSSKDDSLTTVMANFSKIQDTLETLMPETEMKFFVKRTFGMLPFGEENLTTDEKGEVSGTLPADLPGNEDKTITVVAQYEDQENDGIIEVSRNLPWNILPRENELMKRTLWSSGNNAPWSLVIVVVSLITVIWGVIFYLISFLFKIKKLR